MKSIAVLFFAMALVIAFVIASGVPHINEIQVVRPEKQAVSAAAETAADFTCVIVSSEHGVKVIRITARPGEAFLGFTGEEGFKS